MTFAGQCLAAARLDLAEVVRSRWLVFCAAVYVVLAGVLVPVGMRESTMLGFTGMGRVLLAFSHGLVLVLPLLALTATGPVVNRARDDGSLELLLTHPIRRSAWLIGVTMTRYAVLIVPLAALFIAMGVIGQARGQVIPWGFVGRVIAISATLVWAFVGIGMAISVLVRNQARAITYVVLAWGLAVVLLDVGLVSLMLRWRLDPHAVFTLASLNPVQDARLALLSSLEPDLGTLGPVGFYLSTKVGHGALFVLGIAWPIALGTIAWCVGLLGFRRNDIT
jgi:ABC-type transport system involved in multi-copper enzyme maturation permease subunit